VVFFIAAAQLEPATLTTVRVLGAGENSAVLTSIALPKR
jgi:hypothetical protein